MPDFLLQFDRHLFHFINHDLANGFFDAVLPWTRTAAHWIPLYVLVIIFCVWKFKKAGIFIVVSLALAAGFSDFTCNEFIKPAVARVRPCRDPVVSKTDVERIPCGTGYSFPSIHAADHFAAAILAILIFRRKWRWIWFWAILWAGTISFAQIYVGVHYPVDAFCGALYGCLVAWLFYRLFCWADKKYRLNFC